MSAFRNVTKADLLHGIANRRSHYKKELKREAIPLKREVSDSTIGTSSRSDSVKLGDLVDLEMFINDNFKEE